MGEYATYKGEEIKIGTCNEMYYLRWDQRGEVAPRRGSVNPVHNEDKLWFRPPRKAEMEIEPGAFEYYGWCGAEPIRFRIKEDCKAFIEEVHELAVKTRRWSQARHEKIGVVISVPCCHGWTDKLPEHMGYNGFSPYPLGIAGIGIREGHVLALIGCRSCGDTPFCFEFEELVRYCEPIGDDKEDWELTLKQMMEMEAEQIMKKKCIEDFENE